MIISRSNQYSVDNLSNLYHTHITLQSTLFQDDIFPPTKDDAAVMTAEEWLSGVNRQPHKVSLKGDMKSSVLHVTAAAAPAASSPAPQQKQFTAPVCVVLFGV